MPPSQSNRTVALATPLPEDTLLLRSMNGYERLSTPFEYRIAALSTNTEIDLDGLLGETCTVTLATGPSSKRYFKGRCAQISFVGTEGGGLVYELTLRPDFWFLSRNRNCRIFQNMSATDIVSKLLQENGINRFSLKLEHGFPPVRTYCVQYMESDFAFISRLLEHEGYHYYFQHDASGHDLIIADSNAAHTPIAGFEEVPFYPPGELAHRTRNHLDEWSPHHSVMAPAVARATDFFHERPDPMNNSQQVMPAYTGDDALQQTHPAGYEDKAYGAKLAKYRLEAERALRKYATASGNAIGLQAGCNFNLANHPHSRQNAEYLVVETRLHLENDAYHTGGIASAAPERVDIVAIPSSIVFRPALQTPQPRILGTQTAIVTGKSGEEIDTEELGRVKVSFHWDTYSKKDQTSSCWIRVSQAWASGGWGALFTPRIGMEVVVEFIDGDPDRPLIVGAVYNGRNAPPYALPGDKTRSTVKSNSSKGGGGFNEIRFEDKKGQEEIYIHAQKDQNVEILNNLSTKVGNSETRSVGTSRSTTIGSSETKTVGSSETVTIGTSQTLSVGTNRTTTIGMTDALTVGAQRTSTIAISDTTTVGASSTLTVGGAYTINVGGAMMMNVGGVMNITAGGAVNIMAPMVTVMGGMVVITGKSVQVG